MTARKDIKNPFIGLRPFKIDEDEKFFGRQDQFDELESKLFKNRFLAVVGTSGSGKSSLVLAGLIPYLRRWDRQNWHIGDMRPGDNPIGNLASLLNSTKFHNQDEDAKEVGHGMFTEAALRHGSMGLIETIRQFKLQGDILIVVDQFEELFRFSENSWRRLSEEKIFKILESGCTNLIQFDNAETGNVQIDQFLSKVLSNEFKSDEIKNLKEDHSIHPEYIFKKLAGKFTDDQIHEFTEEIKRLLTEEEYETIKKEAEKTLKVEAEKFVKLLIESSNQKDIPIHVVLTMRSDFLGECPLFPKLPETISESQYLIPRLTRSQLREVVKGPIHLAGGGISSRLMSKILNSIVDGQDQLPILQHALMRTFDDWKNDTNEPAKIDLAHFDRIGGMKKALSKHANEIFDDLNPRQQLISKRLFQSLTLIDSEARYIRRPCYFGDICAAAKITESEFKAVVEVYRAPTRSFLMPPVPKILNAKTLIDISHESLMRGWEKLNDWITEEQESRKIYERLSDQALLHKKGQAGYMQNPQLFITKDWWKVMTPTPEWAGRYSGDFQLSKSYLNKSKVRQTLWHIAYVLGIVALFIMAAGSATYLRTMSQYEDLIVKDSLNNALLKLSLSQKDSIEDYVVEVEKARRNERDLKREATERANFFENLTFQLNVALKDAEQARKKSEESLAQRDLSLEEGAILGKFDKTTQEIIVSTLLDNKSSDSTYFRVRRSISLAGDALEVSSINYELGLKIALKAEEINKNPVTYMVANKIKASWPVQPLYSPKTYEDIYNAAISPHSGYTATIDSYGDLEIWDEGGNLKAAVDNNSLNGYADVSFSKKGDHILTTYMDTSARLVDLGGNFIQSFPGHEGLIFNVSFSKDDHYILTASLDSTIRLWEFNGELAGIFSGHRSIVLSAHMLSDNTIISSDYEGTLIKWNKSGQEIARFAGHQNLTIITDVSENGQRFLTLGGDQFAILWDANGNEIRKIEGHLFMVTSAIFGPDEQSIITGDENGEIRIWDFEGRNTGLFGNLNGPINELAISTDGTRLLVAGDYDIGCQVWDYETILNKGGRNNPYLVNLKPLTFDDNIKFRTVELNEILNSRSEDKMIVGADFYRDSWETEKHPYLKDQNRANFNIVTNELIHRLESGSSNQSFDLFKFLKKLVSEEDYPNRFHISKENYSTNRSQVSKEVNPPNIRMILYKNLKERLIKLKETNLAFKIYLEEGSWIENFNENKSFILNSLLSALENPEEYDKLKRSFKTAYTAKDRFGWNKPKVAYQLAKLALSLDDNKATRETLANIKSLFPVIPLTNFRSHFRDIKCVDISDQGTIGSGDEDGEINIWNKDGSVISTISIGTSVRDIEFSPDGNTLIVCSNSTYAKRFDLQGIEIDSFGNENIFVNRATFSPRGDKIATGDYYGTVQIWETKEVEENVKKYKADVKKNREIVSISTELGEILSLTFSSDGEFLLASGTNGDIGLWNMEGENKAIYPKHYDYVNDIAFSSDDNYILSGSDDYYAKIFDQEDHSNNDLYHSSYVVDVEFLPGDKILLTAESDGIIFLWDTNGKIIDSIRVDSYSITDAEVSADGSFLVTCGGYEGIAKVWDLGRILNKKNSDEYFEEIPALTYDQKIEYSVLDLNDILESRLFKDKMRGANYFTRRFTEEISGFSKDNILKKAKEAYDHILGLNNPNIMSDDMSEAYSKYALLLMKIGQIEQGLGLARQGLEIEVEPRYYNYSVIAIGELLLGNVSKAEDLYLTWLSEVGYIEYEFIENLEFVKEEVINSENYDKIWNLLYENY